MKTVPRLDQVDMHTLSDRGAMELPESYTPTRLEFLNDELAELRNKPVEFLASIPENAGCGLQHRCAAALLLGLLGDPRIKPFAPAMLSVAGGRVRIGLEASQIDAVAARYVRYGVKREWIAKEAPDFDVDLAPFRIAKYPVTNREYLEFLKETEYPEIPTSWLFGHYPTWMANVPVFTVTPEAADAYARWLAERTGRRFRLPREVEWEFAAAGWERREFPWGSTFDSSCANTVELGILAPTPVGIFPSGASPFGALDMAGNVEEYVADVYRPYPGALVIDDDLVLPTRQYRIARGGSFTRFADLARCRRRHGRFLSRLYVMGFRLAEDLEPSRSPATNTPRQI